MRLSTKLALAMGLILLFAFQATGAYVLQNVKNHYVDHFSRALAAQGELLAFYLAPYVAKAETEREDIVLADIDNVLRNMTSLSGIRVQVLSSDGVVLAASPPDPAAVGLRNTEPEAQSALSGIPASKRGVRADSGRVEVLAVPIEHDRETVGAVYLIASMEAMYATIAGIMRIYVTGALIALLLTVAVTVLVTRAIVRPLKDLTKQAEAMMGGDFTVRVTVFDDDEIGHLGRAFNTLAGRLRQAMASYEAEQEKLRSILTHMSEGVLATDETGRIVAINPKALTLLGLPGDEAAWIDRPAVGAFGLPEEEEFTDFLSRTGSFFIEVPPGRTLRVTTSPVAHGEKNLGVIAVLSDVTEEKRVEMNQKAFVANVSHELKTPLSTMKSYLEALLEESPETPVARRFLSTVAQETERMIRLVGDLLFLTRLDAEAMPLRLERHDLGGVVRSAAERFARPFAQKGVSLAVDAPEDHFFADIDRDKIDRVLDNVLSNALKFTPEGGRTALTIRAADDGETVEIAVCDTGIGIPESERTRVFERFYRVDKGRSRSLGGSGLGLSIAREIVVRHGGAIEAQGNADGGTTIAIRLPHPQAKGERLMARLKSIVLSALVGVSLLLSAELWLVGTPGLVVNDTPYAAPIRFDRERDPLVLAQPTAIGVADGDRRWLIAPEASEATAVWAWVRGLEVDRMQSPEAIAEGDARKTDAAGGRGSEEPADPGQNGPSAKTALWLSWPSGLPANVWQALFPTWPKPSLSAVDALWVEREGSALRAVVYAVSEGRKQAIDLLAPQDGAIDAWRDVIDVATPTADGAPSVPPHRIPVATGKDAPETVTPAPEAEASVREPALEAFWRPLPEAGSALPTYVLRLQPIDAESAAEALITDVTAMRQARERDGSRLFTDGARSLRIDERAGMLEYFAPVTGPVRPMPENAYETAVQFVNRHAGWTGEFRLAAARESAAEVQFAFHLAVDGWPVLDGAPSVYLLSVGVQGRSVVSYERGLYRPLGMDEDGARLLPDARDVARALQAMGRPASDVARIQVAYAAQPTRTAGVFRLVPGLYVALGDGAARFLTVADELTPAGGEDAAGAPKTRTGEGGGQR